MHGTQRANQALSEADLVIGLGSASTTVSPGR
jgi:thiamine pyrophosphate-dependent acetolactate synthase large subunit-like protein